MNKLDKSQTKTMGFALVKAVIIIFLLLVVALIVWLAIHNSNQTYKSPTATSTTTSNTAALGSNSTFAILAPATVPSKTAECSQQITYSSNGDSGPVTCTNGELNALEWGSLAALEPKVLTLGYGATFGQVQSALCADVHANIKNVIEQTNYQIASLYYGWNFSSNPSVVLSNGTCTNVDD